MQKTKGFTLIELLVVIAIIALLLSIIMPALNMAKKLASQSVCLSNVRQLVIAWRQYAGENDDKLVGPRQHNDTLSHHWAGYPHTGDDWSAGSYISGVNAAGCTIEQEMEGVRNGALYPYYEDVKLAHCPGDKRSLRPPMWGSGTLGGDGGWRTYSIPNPVGMSGDTNCLRLAEIPSPATKYVFLEEGDPRNFNWNSWMMNATFPNPSFTDPFGIFHGDKGIMGFADGHAEKHVWVDEDTKAHTKNLADGTSTGFTFADPGNEDLLWLARHYPNKN